MTITTTRCDRCGRDCLDEFYACYKQNSMGGVLAKEEICNQCFHIMISALEKELCSVIASNNLMTQDLINKIEVNVGLAQPIKERSDEE